MAHEEVNIEKNKDWERELLEKLATSSLDEQRRKRRWGIFFKCLGFVYFGALIFMAMGGLKTGKTIESGAHVALVDLQGEIASDSLANAESINQSLREAFANPSSVGVILRINSPGGSPVQAGMINEEMRRLRAKYPKKPLYAVVEEMCASGGYYVAVGATKIYANQASLVGSIGVVMNGFGFTQAMDKLGVERRLITAGENKGFLDPFSKESPYQTEFARQMVAEIHQQFIKVVKEGRGERLKSNPDLFSGLVWTGAKGVELGLVDQLGSVSTVAREVFKLDNVLDYTQRESFVERVAKSVGVEFNKSLSTVFSSSMPGGPKIQ